jgi:hypothetical protein
MVSNSIVTNDGKNIMLYRAFTANTSLSASSNLAPTKFKVGIDQADVTVADTDLTIPVLIGNGTVNDNGANVFTGSLGGTTSTINTSTYKQGSATGDNSSQNLLANGTNVSKVWTKAALTNAMVLTKPFSAWIYILDATTLAKFATAGTALEFRFRTTGDGATLYKSYTRTAAQLTQGWNYITSGSTLVSGLTNGAGGPPSGTINECVILITTNISTDAFITGDVVYDLLRQWAAADVLGSYSSGYPSFNTSSKQVTIRCYLNSLQASGFLINSLGLFNEDTAPKSMNLAKFSAESKSDSDEFAFVMVNRVL